MVRQAVVLGVVKGEALAVDSTAFKAYSARDAKKGRSDPDADVGRAGSTYILGYRVHLACAEGDVPLAYTVQPISRNDKLFYSTSHCWRRLQTLESVLGLWLQIGSTTLKNCADGARAQMDMGEVWS